MLIFLKQKILKTATFLPFLKIVAALEEIIQRILSQDLNPY